MSTLPTTNSIAPHAALDITTAWGVDSLFRFEYRDPWAEESLVDFIDVLINHESVTVPLPSRQAADHLDMTLFPNSIRIALDHRLLHLKLNAFADSIELTPARLAVEYNRFYEFCQKEQKVRDLVLFHRETPEIVGQNTRHVPCRAVDDFWRNKPADNLLTVLNLPDERCNYAFDVFARTIQYHDVLQQERSYYFRHAFRKTALGNSSHADRTRCTTWGASILEGIRQGFIRRKIEPLLDIVSAIKVASDQVNWYTLANEADQKRIQAMHDIAASANLPGKVKDDVLRSLRVSLGIGASATALPLPIVSVVLTIATVGLAEWKGSIGRPFTDIKVLQGIIERPYLPPLPAPS
ncbi:MAG: hypothetical protein ABSC53_08570 [Bacteroidota bacterium]